MESYPFRNDITPNGFDYPKFSVNTLILVLMPQIWY
jgi:hypothetical protein